MKFASRLAGAVVTAAVAATMLTASPATAAPGDTTMTFAPTAILGENQCIDHAYTYAVELPAGTADWTLTIELVGPDGLNAHRESFGTFNGAAPSGAGAMQLCSVYDPQGTYTIMTTTDYKVGTASTVWGTKVSEGTVQVVGQAKSQVSLKAKRKGSKVTATAKVGVSTGGAYGPVAQGGKVTFQKKVGKKWKKVDAGTTDASGIVKAKFKAKKGTVVRAVFAGAGEVIVGSGGPPVPAATSKAVRIR